MPYQGDPTSSNGYWPGNGSAYGAQGAPPQFNTNGTPAQYHNSTTMDPQHWNQQSHGQYAMQTAYPMNGFYSSAPVQHIVPQPFEPPQYLNPADLLQHSSTPPQHQHAQKPLQARKPSTPAPNSSVRNGSAQFTGSESDRAMLLVSLAEEYFEAAHNLAPAVATSMSEENIKAYDQLVATGLGCLDTALKNIRLAPRVEAKIRLRYAGVLFEETDNFMEAETALSKGVALCERNHYYDLKYSMQFLLAQFMSRKSPKASMKALDGYIADAQVYQHFSWVYAFRFLRASQALDSGGAADAHSAIQSLRGIANLASQQGDRSIFLVASLMETMAHLKSTAPDAIEHVQRAIAAAFSCQLDPGSRLPQLVGLTHILDVVCSIRQGSPSQMISKLKAMQEMMDAALSDDETWSKTSAAIAIPIGQPRIPHIVSSDTRTVLDIGDDGQEKLIMFFLNKKDAYAITYLLCGAVLLHKNSADQKGIKYLGQGFTALSDLNSSRALASAGVLPELLSSMQWRGEVLCYFYLYIAFCEAAVADWATVKTHVDQLTTAAKKFDVSLAGPLGYFTAYITGVYHQGVGNFDTALRIYEDERFNMRLSESSICTSADQLERDIALLSKLNALLILQEDRRADPIRNTALIETLTPLCTKHPVKDIETAFNIAVATVKTNPPAPGFMIKNYLRAALGRAQASANTQFLCITLNIMCDRFFANIVGAQAEKSAMAASIQAKKSGNLLWRSVADGMLAKCYEVQGKQAEAQATMEQARNFSEAALPT